MNTTPITYLVFGRDRDDISICLTNFELIASNIEIDLFR